MDVEFKMDRLRRQVESPSTDQLDPFLVADDLHGHDDNPFNHPSRPCAAKPPILFGQPSAVGYAIRSLYLGTRNQILWLYRKRTNVLSQTPDLGVNFDASSTTKITTGNFGWFRTVIDVGDLPTQNWSFETQGNHEAIACMSGLKRF